MIKRTQAEVDALWPDKKDQYKFTARVTAPARVKTKAEAAALIQKLFDPEGGVAGLFDVMKRIERDEKESVFEVVFTRFVEEDYEILDERLLKGWDFNRALSAQFDAEIKDAKTRLKWPGNVKLTTTARFSKIRL